MVNVIGSFAIRRGIGVEVAKHSARIKRKHGGPLERVLTLLVDTAP